MSAPAEVVDETVVTDTPARPSILAWIGDGTALALWLAILWYLEQHDGGLEPFALANVGVVALLATPTAIVEARGLPAIARVALGALGVGTLLGFAFAVDRSNFVAPLLVTGIVPIAFLAALRLARRPWGPVLLFALLVATLGKWWYRSFLQWWGTTLSQRVPQWAPLSWHNQSGIFMAAFGLTLAGIALVGRRLIALAGGLAAAAALAGVWLSGSRGASLSAAIGLGVVTFAGLRVVSARAVAIRVAATLAAAALIVLGLSAMVPGGAQPIFNRETDTAGNDLGGNTRARIEHWQTAIRMFADRPLTGQGPGSYREIGRLMTDAEGNLTSSAHNEYLEAFAEGGLVTGIPVVVLVGLGLVVAARRLRRAPEDERERHAINDVRIPLGVGATGAVVALVIHAGIDFDWGYLVVPAFLGLCIATIMAARPVVPSTPPAWHGLIVLPIAIAVAGAATGAFAERISYTRDRSAPATAEQFAQSAVPWDSRRNTDIAFTLSARDEYELARAVIDRTRAWSPGDEILRIVDALVGYRAEDIDVAELIAVLDDDRSPLFGFTLVAEDLIARGALGPARGVLVRVFGLFPRYQARRPATTNADAWVLLIRLDGIEGGCAAARVTAELARADPHVDALEGADEAFRAEADEACAST